MKISMFALCAMLSSCLAAVPVRSVPLVDKAVMEPNTVKLDNATLEGGLLQFARAGGFNFLIDSTSIGAKPERTTKTFSGKFGPILTEYTRPHDLSLARLSQSTFLFWQAAEVEEIVRRLLNGQSYRTEPNEVSVDALFTMLRDYARQHPEARARLPKPFPINDLPEPLRAPVAAAAFSSLLSQPSQPRMLSWLGEEVWKSARVQLGSISQATIEEARQTGMKFYALRWLLIQAPFTSPAGTVQMSCTLPEGIDRDTSTVAKEVPAGAPLHASNGDTLRLLSSPRPPLEASSGQALEALITLEVERKPLRQVLDEVEKQSGVRLSTQEAPVLDALLLSARAQKMPLFEMLNGIGRLYSIGWKKVGEREWAADATPRTEHAILATRVGDMQMYKWEAYGGKGYKDWLAAADETIARALEEVDENTLRSPEGVPFSALSPQVQKEIQEGVRSRIKLILASTQSLAVKAVRDGMMVNVSPDGEILGVHLKDEAPYMVILNRSIYEDAIALEKKAKREKEIEELRKKRDAQP